MAGAPWYVTPGDHDVNPPEFILLSADRTRETWFTNLCDSIGLSVSETLYYSFDVGDYHFVLPGPSLKIWCDTEPVGEKALIPSSWQA